MTRLAHEALIPNPRLAGFAPFIGEWRTEGNHAMIPGVTLHGRTAFEWHEGGGFLSVRTETDEPQVPSAVALIGSDDEHGTLTMLYFDERGISRQLAVTVVGNVLTWERLVPGFSQRYVLTLAADGQRAHGRSTLCQDGVHWTQDMELTYTRVPQ